jgi:hypothetical protein
MDSRWDCSAEQKKKQKPGQKDPPLAIKISKLLPSPLGHVKEPHDQETPCSRTRSIAALSRLYLESKRLKPWQFGAALAQAMCEAL